MSVLYIWSCRLVRCFVLIVPFSQSTRLYFTKSKNGAVPDTCDSHRTVTPGTAHLAWPLIAPMVQWSRQRPSTSSGRGVGGETAAPSRSSQLRSDVPHAPQRDAQSVRGAVGLEERLLLRTLSPDDGPYRIREALCAAARREHTWSGSGLVITTLGESEPYPYPVQGGGVQGGGRPCS